MRAVVASWTGSGFIARIAITSLTGAAWAVRSIQEIAFHPNYVNPITAADHFAVYAYSAAFLLTAASLLILRDIARPSTALSLGFLVVAAAAAVTGIANGVEDGLGLRGVGVVYVTGILSSTFGLLALAVALGIGSARRFAFIPAVGGVAMATMVTGGGVLGLVAWLGLGAILVRERSRPGVRPVRN